MLLRLEAVVVEVFALRHLGQVRLLFLVALPHLVETIEREDRTGHTEHVLAAFDLDLCLVVNGRRHPAGDESSPDELVELLLVRAEVLAHGLGGPVDVSRSDALVRILRTWAHLAGPRPTDVLVPVLLLDPSLDLGLGFGRDARRVGTHIGDQTRRAFVPELDTFVEVLGHAHGAAWRKTQPARGILLQRRGDVRQIGALGAALLLDADDLVARAFEPPHDLLGLGFGPDHDLGVGLGLAFSVRFAVGVGLGRFVAQTVEPSEEVLVGLLLCELDIDRPRLDRDELSDLLLAVYNQAQRNRRDPARADPLLHLAPEERAQSVADQTVDDPARLLGIDEAHVDLSRGLERPAHRLGRDLVELDPLG